MRVAVPCFFIIATIALTQYSQIRKTRVPNDYVEDLTIQMVGKSVVGLRYLQGTNPARSEATSKSMRESLKRYQNTGNRILTVPITAELSGRDAAISELVRMEKGTVDKNVKRDIPLFLKLYRNGASSLSPQERQPFKRYGWLGELALSQGMPDTSPERKAILNSALRALVMSLLLTLAVLGAVVAGIVLFILAIVFRTQGRLNGHFVVPGDPAIYLLEAFAIYLTGWGALPLLVRWIFPGFKAAVAIQLLAVVVAALWPRFRGLDWRSYRRAIGWYRGQGVLREIGAGITGYIAGLPIVVVASIVVAVLSRIVGRMPVHPIVFEFNRGLLYTIFLALLACVWAPVVEETFFRGAFFGSLRRYLHWGLSGILAGLVFAAIHPQGWLGIPVIGAIGFNLSAIREWRGSLIASMSAHAFNNGTLVLVYVFIVG